MQFIKLNAYIELKNLLIRQEHTGTAEEFTRKLGVSERTLQNHLQQFREIGVQVIYDYTRRTNKYTDKGRLSLSSNAVEMIKIRGGSIMVCYRDFCDFAIN